MDECCNSPKGRSPASRRRACPECGVTGISVGQPTIAHHLNTPASWTPSATRHFFCASPTCDIVYFGDDGSRIARDMLHTRVGIKDDDGASLLCYCFKLSRADFEGDASLRRFVEDRTRAGECSCETSNPSGRCCLKDLPHT